MNVRYIHQSKKAAPVLASLALAAGLLALSLVLIVGLARAGPTADSISGEGVEIAPGSGDGPWAPTGGPVASGGQVNGLAVHPAISGAVYAAVAPIGAYDSGPSVIYKTTEGAASWTPVYTTEHQVYALAVTGTNVYAGAFNPGGEGPAIYVSNDSGVNWTPAFSFTERGVWVDMAVHPTDTNTAIAGGWMVSDTGQDQGVVYGTDDGGLTWSLLLAVTVPDDNAHIVAVLIHPITPTLLLAAANADGSPDSVIYRSEDGGVTWPVSVTIPDAQVMSLAANTDKPQMLYAGAGGSSFTKGPNMAFRSTDAGLSWTEVFAKGGGHLVFEPPSTVYAGARGGEVWSSPSDGDPGTWSSISGVPGVMSFDIDLGPAPAALYLGDERRGVLKSADGGVNWEERNDGIETAVPPVDIDVDPQDLNKLFAAAECSGGWMTTDGGKNWTEPSGIAGCMGAFAINPDDPNVVYGGAYDCSRGAVLRSDDGGLNFEPVYTATFILPDCSTGDEHIFALAIAPSVTSTVYAAGRDRPNYEKADAVILRSLDDGVSWTEVFTLPSKSHVRALAIDPANDDTVYAGGEQCVEKDCTGFVYRTTDGGDTWTLVFTTTETVRSIVIDHQEPHVLYASADNYEVYKSTDGGDTWTTVRTCCPSGNLLAIDPHVPSHVYLGGYRYIAESADGGQTWSEWDDPINQGMPEMELRALTVDTGTPTQTLYAGFSGVWYYRRLAPQEGTRYVATTGSDAGNLCVDPAAPCQTIGHAVDVANPGESILVTQGTYTETLTISKAVTLTGGYEAVNWTRDLTQYETIIDGSGSQTLIGDGDGWRLQKPAVISDGGKLKMWYQDFEQGVINYAESDDGISSTKSPSNPVFTPGTPGQWGEPVVRFEAGSDGAVLDGFTITGGDAEVGSGVLVEESSAVIANSTITGNTAGHGGGGIMVDNYAQAQIANVVVEHNSADYGGGIAVRSGSSAFISGTRVISNTANNSGGGVGIWSNGPTVVMSNTVISNNYGYDSGGLSMWEPGGAFTGTNLLIVDNRSGPGPAGIALEGSGQLMNVTVAGNDSATGFDGAEIHGPASGFSIVNSIFWGNGTDGANLGGSNLNVSYSDVEGGWPGTGNIDANPLFVDVANGDYHLQVSSPCIDAGTSVGAPAADLEGTPRDAAPDMGAYEWVRFRIFLPMTLKSFASK